MKCAPEIGPGAFGCGRSSVSTWVKLDREAPETLAARPHPAKPGPFDEQISAISAVTISPVRRRPDLHFRLPPDNADAHGEDATAFLAQSRGELRGPMTILRDQSKVHERSSVVKAYLAKHPEIVTEDFHGDAPEANPDERVWGWTKYHRLPNYAPESTNELRSHLWDELSSLRRRRDLLASFVRYAEIPLPPDNWR